MELTRTIAQYSTAILEMLGIMIIVALSLYSVLYTCIALLKGAEHHDAFRDCRQKLARGIVTGLELLIAADVIKTVALDLTFTSIGALAAIVLIRTFLSATLELEMTGNWPWQQNK
ncbi:hypothetical protein STSP2_01285 [Anaerohalosphaera lusitana]|uniref:DUF1622 domain-containing protein n=1 Tax=Anaerohalosphaera lusitana TaxID=1936003 RepID=A0A1U9NKL2_9BACT|nr:DUF1622 domain-containing protein [Anaerohalosphaera lusitana]AQT68130.1 hypothetical protein STSP2_01285 [Anaerohalosphaera lusitana]